MSQILNILPILFVTILQICTTSTTAADTPTTKFTTTATLTTPSEATPTSAAMITTTIPKTITTAATVTKVLQFNNLRLVNNCQTTQVNCTTDKRIPASTTAAETPTTKSTTTAPLTTPSVTTPTTAPTITTTIPKMPTTAATSTTRLSTKPSVTTPTIAPMITTTIPNTVTTAATVTKVLQFNNLRLVNNCQTTQVHCTTDKHIPDSTTAAETPTTKSTTTAPLTTPSVTTPTTAPTITTTIPKMPTTAATSTTKFSTKPSVTTPTTAPMITTTFPKTVTTAASVTKVLQFNNVQLVEHCQSTQVHCTTDKLISASTAAATPTTKFTTTASLNTPSVTTPTSAPMNTTTIPMTVTTAAYVTKVLQFNNIQLVEHCQSTQVHCTTDKRIPASTTAAKTPTTKFTTTTPLIIPTVTTPTTVPLITATITKMTTTAAKQSTKFTTTDSLTTPAMTISTTTTVTKMPPTAATPTTKFTTTAALTIPTVTTPTIAATIRTTITKMPTIATTPTTKFSTADPLSTATVTVLSTAPTITTTITKMPTTAATPTTNFSTAAPLTTPAVTTPTTTPTITTTIPKMTTTAATSTTKFVSKPAITSSTVQRFALPMLTAATTIAQQCSSADLTSVQNCGNTVNSILDSIESQWPVPAPLPAINNTVISQICSAYNTYLTCIAPKNASCGNTQAVLSIVNVIGYVCVTKNTVFTTQSDCVKNYLTSPDVSLSQCMFSASEIQYHNLEVIICTMSHLFSESFHSIVSCLQEGRICKKPISLSPLNTSLVETTTDQCNAFKDASSCVYPLVQTKCGADIANALHEFTIRYVQTLAGGCSLITCASNAFCFYDQTCRSDRTCQCAVVCPVQNSPQCSSDGRIYGNSCLMRSQACVEELWLIKRPMPYCTLQNANPSICTDTNVDQYAHCVTPLYSGVINSFKDIATFLSNFNGNMINKTCQAYNQMVSCTLNVPTVCQLANGGVLGPLYKNYICTDKGYTDLTQSTICWQALRNDISFQQCLQNFNNTVATLQYYSQQEYINSLINDFGTICTSLNAMRSCTLPRAQALCDTKALTAFTNVFNSNDYEIFQDNCGVVCKALISDVYGIISSNNWPAANTDSEQCTWVIITPTGMNVNLLLRVSQPFDCYPDNPVFLYIYSGSSADPNRLLYSYCGASEPDNVFSTSSGVNEMTVVYTKTASNNIASPAFLAMFYAGTDACLSNPCVGGSTCLGTAGGYYCQCQAGYVGSLCNRYVGKCNLAVCQNGGTCIDTYVITDISMANGEDPSQDFGFYCQCPTGYGGLTCQSTSNIPERIDAQCPAPFVAFGQQCYFVNSSRITEPLSEDACKSFGGDSLLGSIHSDAERTFVTSLMQQSGATDVWIGARHSNTVWFWLDNSAFNYTAWVPDPPNTGLRCVVQSASANYTWATQNCFPQTNSYFCKMSPPIVCEFNPCLNNGTCVTVALTSSCQCLSLFTGTVCENLVTCSPNPCLNGGLCRSSNNINSCACPPGYNGTRCEVFTTSCTPNPCKNNGRCSISTSGYNCACLLGYTDANCSTNINECASNPCLNSGTCIDGVNRFSCSCVAGFTGLTCNININECASAPCQNAGTCTDGVNNYTCACASGFSGNNCQTSNNTCPANACSNGGTCIPSVNSFTCVCATGFTGPQCQSPINYCASTPCQNSGTCQSLTSGYVCSCLTGFSGTNCETNNSGNLCTPNPCNNGGTCNAGTNQFSCQCASGFTGPTCNTTSGQCTPTSCSNSGLCIDLNGAFTCSCPSSFSGIQCQLSGTAVCITNNPCINGGSCSYTQGITVCSCPTTFQGPNCGTGGTNLCSNFPCLNGGTCVSGIDYYICLCATGYTGDTCQTVIGNGACLSSPCLNNGQCVTTSTGYLCNCAAGYTGTNCNINTNTGVCINNLCQNGATCSPTSSTAYVCICQTGYSGFYCDQLVNPCLSSPCQNGATCIQGFNSYQCQCLTGFGGPTCSQPTGSLCSPNPCQNSGLCVSISSTQYVCQCANGWSGASCEVDVNECLQLPCLNGATCTNTVGSFYCNCSSGYSGFDCSYATNPCISNPCSNGATCTVVQTNSYQCTCTSDYIGPNCAARLCQQNWKYYNNYCYYVASNAASQSDAKIACTANSTVLASVQDVNERNFITSMMSSNNIAQAWIGAVYNSSSSSFYWTDQTTWSYTSWGSGQPLSPSTLQCTLQNGNAWQTANCNNADPSVCKGTAKIYATPSTCSSKPCLNNGTCTSKGGTYTCTCPAGFGGTNCESANTGCTPNPCSNSGTCTIVGTSTQCTCKANYTVQSNCQTACPSGWLWFIGKCYLAVNTAATYQTALSDCQSRQSGSKLYYSDTQDDFYFACTLANKMSSSIWLGLQYDSSTTKYRWSKGTYLSSSDYKPWGNNQPSNQNTNTCVAVRSLQGFVWESSSCTALLKYICKWDGSAF